VAQARIDFGRFAIEVVALDRIDLLEKNARFMRNETFRRLVENVKADGHLSQIPFCVRRGERFLCLSGNHRVMAARAAGLDATPIIYATEELTREQELGIQLSHNAIAGEDDPQLLKELFDELTTVAGKLYTGLDDKALATLAAVSMPALSEVKLDFRTVTLMFLPEETPDVKTAFDEARKLVSGQELWLARFQDFDRLLDALAASNAAHNVKNTATGMLCLMALFARHQTDLAEGWFDPESEEAKHAGWVPLSSIFGTDKVPAAAAAVIKRAVDRAVSEEDATVEARWKFLELIAADYLAGVTA
jgi:hypothetical protein